MSFEYRKYSEPEYGAVSPEVEIPKPQAMDLNNPEIWRTSCHLETIAELVSEWKICNCFGRLMEIKTKNFAIESDGASLPARVYYPKAPCLKKALIFYHGGGFMMNNADVYDQVYRYIAYFGGITVIAPDYRLSPENKFPAAVNDSYNTVAWTEENMSKFNIEEIYVAGDSAGGNLAAATAIMARDKKAYKISGQILIYPVISFKPISNSKSEKLYGTGHFLEFNSKDKTLNKIYLNNESDEASPYVSPLLAESLENLPKACFISAECDPLLDQALMYAARLEDEGNSVEFNIYKGMIHAFINRPHNQTIKALDKIIDFIKR